MIVIFRASFLYLDNSAHILSEGLIRVNGTSDIESDQRNEAVDTGQTGQGCALAENPRENENWCRSTLRLVVDNHMG